MDARAVAAAWNNAEWCDAVCRAHGITTSFDPAGDVLRRVDGCKLPAAPASSAWVRCASG